MSEPLAVSIKDAAHLLGFGRTTIEKLIREGKLESVKIGTAINAPVRITYASLKKLLEPKEEAA